MPNSALLFPQPPPSSVAVSMGKPQVGGGESFTIICFTCGMPSSKEWAQKVDSCQKIHGKPFYPFLTYMKAPHPAALFNQEDGTTFLCAFCHASVEAQWTYFEKTHVSLKERNFNLNNFICAVCSVTTYRKRVRAIPFQEFPFLGRERPAGSLTLGRNPLAVVCLDCSETLWAQSAEYDRWGLPVEKRHFNWMSRPPPPENSMEATVARLPSGETQLPRCPPVEPTVLRRKEPLIKGLLKTGSEVNPQFESTVPFRSVRSPPKVPVQGQPKVKKTSTGSLPEQQSLQGQTVPIVTVAPMASITTLTNVTTSAYSKDSMLSSNLMATCDLSKMESLRFAQKTEPRHPNAVLPTFFPSTSIGYGSYSHWGGGGGLEPFPPLPHTLEPTPPQGQLPWIHPHLANPDFLRYQAYLSSIANTSYASAVESYFSQSHPHPLLQVQDPQLNPIQRVVSPSSASVPIQIRMNPTYLVQECADDVLQSQSSASSLQYANTQPSHGILQSQLEMPSRKRSATSSPPISKIPPVNSSVIPKTSSSSSGYFVSMPRISRHLNAQKGVERNKDYIVSASEILSESESVRQRALKNNVTGLPPPKRRYDREEVGAMDLSLLSVLTTPTRDLKNSPKFWNPAAASFSQESIRPVPTNDAGDEKKQNNFLIANLCSENMSPPGRVNSKSPRETDTGNRDSVIVSLSQSLDSPKPPILLPSPPPLSSLQKPTVGEVTKRAGMTPTHLRRLFSPAQPTPNCIQPMDTKGSEVNGDGQEKRCTRSPPEVQILEEEMPKTKIEEESKEDEIVNVVELCFTVKESEDDVFLKSRQEFLAAETQRREKLEMEKKAKERFLKFFQLVNMHEKNELELKILRSRHERKTLLPLKFRPEEPAKEESMSEDLEKELLRTAFEDPSLRKTHNDPELLHFMKSLEMKPASKAQKYRREENWRVLLAERMLRFKRCRTLSCEKRPWERMNKISRELIGPLRRRHSIPPASERKGMKMRTLSLNLPPEPPHPPGPHSTDLLTTVERQKDRVAEEENISSRMGMSSQNLEKILKLTRRSRQPVITYPKYIPSYAQTHVARPPEQPPPGDPKKRNDDLINVPLPTTRTLPLTTSYQKNGLGTDSAVDSLIQRSSASWKETKEDIERLMKLDSEQRRVPTAGELKKLRKSISSQQLEMKAMVKWLKELAVE